MENAARQMKKASGSIGTGSRLSIDDLEETTRSFARARPVIAVLAALSAGYLVARLASRR